MRLSDKGKKRLIELEGYRGNAYLDQAGVWTIGYGFTKGVKEGDFMNRAAADKRLDEELVAYEMAVGSVAKAPTQGQFDAMVILAWNIGIAGFKKSTVVKAHNRGDFAAAAQAFSLWNKVKGKVNAGLVKRRAAEAQMYLEGVVESGSSRASVPDVPQVVDAEKPLLKSTQVNAGAITAVVSAAGAAAQVSQSFATVRDSLGDLLPYAALAAAIIAIGTGLYVVWERYQQRKAGVA